MSNVYLLVTWYVSMVTYENLYPKPLWTEGNGCTKTSARSERWRRVLYGQNKIDAIHFLQGKALLSVQKTHCACNGNMIFERYDQCKGGYKW